MLLIRATGEGIASEGEDKVKSGNFTTKVICVLYLHYCSKFFTNQQQNINVVWVDIKLSSHLTGKK